MGFTAQDLFNKKGKANAKKSILGGKKTSILSTGPNLKEVSNQVNNASRRLRIIEERYINLRKKTQLTEQNMIATNKKLLSDVRSAFDEIADIHKEVKKINDQITVMQTELNDCANRHDVVMLDKYVDFWNPMEFLTQEEAKKIIENFK